MALSAFLKELDRLITKENFLEWDENDMAAFISCIRKDKKSLEDSDFHPRLLIDSLKNFPDELDFLLEYLVGNEYFERSDPRSYFFSGIIDNKSFDIYKKYNIDSFKLISKEISKEQLEYIFSIGFITRRQYYEGFYDYDVAETMDKENLTYEEYFEKYEKENTRYNSDDEII